MNAPAAFPLAGISVAITSVLIRLISAINKDLILTA